MDRDLLTLALVGVGAYLLARREPGQQQGIDPNLLALLAAQSQGASQPGPDQSLQLGQFTGQAPSVTREIDTALAIWGATNQILTQGFQTGIGIAKGFGWNPSGGTSDGQNTGGDTWYGGGGDGIWV